MAFLDLNGLRKFKAKLDEKFSAPIEAIRSWKPSSNGTAGQILRSNGDGTTSWQNAASSQDVADAVDSWMDEHISPNTAVALDTSLTSATAAAQAAAAGSMVVVSDTQPSGSTNRVWIKKTPNDDIIIPTVEDVEVLYDDLLDRHEELAEEVHNIGHGLSDEAKIALLACFRKTAWVDSHGQEYYDALHDALYPEVVLKSVHAIFEQGSREVFVGDALSTLKPYLSVYGYYSDGTVEDIPDYLLSGTLTLGISIISVSYGGKSTTFFVTVSNQGASISDISATFNPGTHIVFTDDSIDSLKPYLTVLAQYSDGTTGEVGNYQLFGSLTAGTNTITVTYKGITTSFLVTAYEPDGITAVFDPHGDDIYNTTPLNYLKQYLTVTYLHLGESTTLNDNEYSLSGTLNVGANVITVTYAGITTTFNVVATLDPAMTIMYALPGVTYFDGTQSIDTGLRILSEDRDFTIVYDVYSDEHVPVNSSNEHRGIFHCMDETGGSPWPGISAWTYSFGSRAGQGFNSTARQGSDAEKQIGAQKGISHIRGVITHKASEVFTKNYLYAHNFADDTDYEYDFEVVPGTGSFPVMEQSMIIGAERSTDGVSLRRFFKGVMLDLKVHNYEFTAEEANNYLHSVYAVYDSQATVFDTTPLNDLKQYITLTYTHNGVTETIDSSKYTLEGTLNPGYSEVYAVYKGKRARIEVYVMGSNGELYSLPSAKSFTVTGNIIDTKIPLMEAANNFTVVGEFTTLGTVGGNNQLAHCMEEVDPFNGFGMRFDAQNGSPKLRMQTNGSTKVTLNTNTFLVGETARFVAIADFVNGTCNYYFYTPSTGLFTTSGDLSPTFIPTSRTLLIGGGKNSTGGYIRSANTSVSEFKVYNRAFTDAQARAYVGGGS